MLFRATAEVPALSSTPLPLMDRPRQTAMKQPGRPRKNRCRFCTKYGCPRPAFVDYKDVPTLKLPCSNQGKILSRKRAGNCAAF